MNKVWVYVLELEETYVFAAKNEYKCFESVEFVGLNNRLYHGIILDESIATRIHGETTKIVL